MEEQQAIDQIFNLTWTEHKALVRKSHADPGHLLADVHAYMASAPANISEIWKEHKHVIHGLRVFPARIHGSVHMLSLDDPKTLLATYKATALSRAAASSFEVPAPPGLSYLPFQRAGIEYASHRDHTLIADEMGLGKTIQAIGFCNLLRGVREVILVVPAYLKLNWKVEIEKWFIGEASVVIVNAQDEFPAPPRQGRTQFTVINYDILHRYNVSRTFDVGILDEAHFCKNMETKRTKAVMALNVKRWMMLTGTPALNRPIELYPLIKLGAGSRAPSLNKFAKTFCGAKKNGFGTDNRGCTNPIKLQQFLRSTFMIRRLKSQVLKELPPKRRQVIELPPTSEIKMALDMEREAWAPHEDTLIDIKIRMDDAAIADDDEAFMELASAMQKEFSIAFHEMAKARVMLSELKAPIIASHAREFLDSAEIKKLIVFFYHKEACRIFAEALKDLGSVMITGDVPMEQRHELVTRFQTDPSCQVIVGTIGAMGTGFTLHAADTVIMGELDWRPGIIAQAEDRSHRIGQKRSVLCQYFLFEDSVDSKMIGDIIAKMEILSRILDCADKTDAPVTPQGERKTPPRKRRSVVGAPLTKELGELVLEGIKMLAGSDKDMARTRNNAGFSKFDTYTGHRLAAKDSLSKKEAEFGRDLLWKYRRQLDQGTFRILWPDVQID